MSKFLKLIEQSQPGPGYKAQLIDPDGNVVNEFTMHGDTYAFDNFQEFKEEFGPGVEDGESEDQALDTLANSLAQADAVTNSDVKKGLFQKDGKKAVAKAKNKIYNKMAKQLNTIANEI